MTSGNFAIGWDLTLKGFDEYIKPLFEKRNYSVKDKLGIPYNKDRKSVLISVIGEGDLEKGINDALIEAGEVIVKKENERAEKDIYTYNSIARINQVKTEHRYNKDNKFVYFDVGVFETIGLYQAEDAASQLFPSIAQEYLLKDLELKAVKVGATIKDLLGKKLSEL